jgi:hypothetical protein
MLTAVMAAFQSAECARVRSTFGADWAHTAPPSLSNQATGRTATRMPAREIDGTVLTLRLRDLKISFSFGMLPSNLTRGTR